MSFRLRDLTFWPISAISLKGTRFSRKTEQTISPSCLRGFLGRQLPGQPGGVARCCLPVEYRCPQEGHYLAFGRKWKPSSNWCEHGNHREHFYFTHCEPLFNNKKQLVNGT